MSLEGNRFARVPAVLREEMNKSTAESRPRLNGRPWPLVGRLRMRKAFSNTMCSFSMLRSVDQGGIAIEVCLSGPEVLSRLRRLLQVGLDIIIIINSMIHINVYIHTTNDKKKKNDDNNINRSASTSSAAAGRAAAAWTWRAGSCKRRSSPCCAPAADA